MEGWVDLGCPAMHRPGVELATSRSQVWHPNYYTTEYKYLELHVCFLLMWWSLRVLLCAVFVLMPVLLCFKLSELWLGVAVCRLGLGARWGPWRSGLYMYTLQTFCNLVISYCKNVLVMVAVEAVVVVIVVVEQISGPCINRFYLRFNFSFH